jgi:hypothetical protein
MTVAVTARLPSVFVVDALTACLPTAGTDVLAKMLPFVHVSFETTLAKVTSGQKTLRSGDEIGRASCRERV